MKTAVSIPDELFEQAERLARRRGVSRSRLLSEALREYLARHSSEQITEAMDRGVDELGEEARPDRFVASASRQTLERSKW